MGLYILKRLALIVPTLFGIMLLNFAIIQIAPGGPVDRMILRLTSADSSGATSGFSGAGGVMLAEAWRAVMLMLAVLLVGLTLN